MKHKWIILVCIMALVLGGIGSSTLRKKNIIMGGGPGDTTVGTAGGGSWLDGGAFTTDGPIDVSDITSPGDLTITPAGGEVYLATTGGTWISNANPAQPLLGWMQPGGIATQQTMGIIYESDLSGTGGFVFQNRNDAGGFTANLVTFFDDGGVHIGGTTPPGAFNLTVDGILTAFKSSSGGTPNADSPIIIESNGSANFQMLGGTNHYLGILFGDSADNDAGFLQYHTGSESFRIGVNAAQRWIIDSSGNITQTGDLTSYGDGAFLGGDFIVGSVAAGNIGTTTNPNQFQFLTATTALLESSLEFEGGDTFWTGDGSGVPYGSMYNDNTDTTVTMGTSGTAVRIPSGFTTGQTNLATFQNNRELVITKAGRYKISWSISFNTLAGSNQEIEGHIGVDNAEVGPGSAHRFIGTGTDKGNMGGNAILDLAASAIISLMIVNDSDTNDVNVNHADLVLTMVGGT